MGLLMSGIGGCAARDPVNPSFDLTAREARTALDRMAEAPTGLERPVVVLDGWMNPGLATLHLDPALRRYTGGEVVSVTFFGARSFEQCARRVIEKVDAAFPPPAESGADVAADATVPVDVVAYSMGGLVARYAALPREQRAALAAAVGGDEASVGERRLEVVRLFTISSPHRGAGWAGRAATWLPGGRLVEQMQSRSPLIERLEATADEASYTLYPYVRLGDRMVGPANAAPPGRAPWWVPRLGWVSLSHIGAYKDVRIVADIVARLRGEEPFATAPPAPLPER